LRAGSLNLDTCADLAEWQPHRGDSYGY
jgi:hypothetical protein